MKLDLTSFEKAIASLEEILAQPKNKFIRAGTIQCFEYTFELAWKSMQRLLKEQGVVTGSPMQAFRGAHKARLIDDVGLWAQFLKERNLTVHTYNEDVAEEVYQAAQQFVPEVKRLLTRIKEENK